MIGLGLSITQRAVLQMLRAEYSPAGLFAAGEQGAWYDPSDMITMFQDAAGTTPVTAVEQPVGRILDKSGRGNHATQTTSTSRPVLSARVNLLTATETLATQTVTTRATTQTLRFEGAGTVTLSGTATGTYSAGSHSVSTTAGNLTLTVSGTVTKADLRASNMGVGLPAYQAVVNSTTYDTTGFPKYLRFDGVDDFLVTNSINFTSTDKMTVFAGVRDLSTALASIVELSAVTNTLSGAFVLYGRVAANGDSAFGLNTGGSYGYRKTGAPAAFPYSAVISDSLNGATGNLSTAVQPRINGATPSLTNTGSVGAGNFGNYPLYIGRRGGTSLPANINLYSLIVRGAQSSAGQIASTESWVNVKTGAY